jgi:hypothetical protein
MDLKKNAYRFNLAGFVFKRVNAWLVVLIILAIFHIANVLTSKNQKLVFQLEQVSNKQQIDKIGHQMDLIHNYKLQVDSPNWFYSMIIENNLGWSPMTTFMTLILASCGLLLRSEVDLKKPFDKDLSKQINIAAVATLLLFLLEKVAYNSISQNIELKQLEGFSIIRLQNFWLCYTSLGLFWLASIMKKGYQLQKEQNLTI